MEALFIAAAVLWVLSVLQVTTMVVACRRSRNRAIYWRREARRLRYRVNGLEFIGESQRRAIKSLNLELVDLQQVRAFINDVRSLPTT